MNSQSTGQRYEQLAADLLKAAGATILETNYHCKLGEIDIICIHDEQLVFVEVKYRKSALYGSAVETVTPKKQLRLRLAASHYCMHQTINRSSRFDVIGFTGTAAPEWIRNAFY